MMGDPDHERKVDSPESKENLPTVATFTLDPQYKQGVIWNNDVDNAPELEEGDELVRREDIAQIIDEEIILANTMREREQTSEGVAFQKGKQEVLRKLVDRLDLNHEFPFGKSLEEVTSE